MLVKVETLTKDLSQVRLFHTSVSRANATWTGVRRRGQLLRLRLRRVDRPEVPERRSRPTSPCSSPAWSARTPTWSRACTGRSCTSRCWPTCSTRTSPTSPSSATPPPTSSSTSSSAWSRPSSPATGANPAYDDVEVNGTPDGRVEARSKLHPARLPGRRRHHAPGPEPHEERPDHTFVSSDHGFAPQFLAVDASKVLVDLGLLSTPADVELPPGHGRDHRQGQGVLGRRHRADLPEPGRARPRRRRAHSRWRRPTRPPPWPRSRPPSPPSPTPTDWTGDGAAEGWKVIDRAYTKAEARYIPNGPGSTADMANPTRTGDVVAFAYPPYQFDAETPGTLVALSQFFGQHGYVPDVQDLTANTNMRATFLAGGRRIATGQVVARTIDVAPTIAYLLGVPEPQHSQGRVLLEMLKGQQGVKPVSIIGHQRLPRPARPDHARRPTALNVSVGGAAQLATLFDEDAAALARPGAAPGRGRQRGRQPAELGAAAGQADHRRGERLGPGRHVLRQPRVRLRRRAAAHPSGPRHLPVPGREHRRHRATGAAPTGSRRRRCSP